MILLIMTIQWEASLELHIKVIDLQHQQLVKITNKLLKAFEHSISPSELDLIFQEVINYTNYHFNTEEFFLKKFNCDPSQTEIHIQEHQRFKKEIITLFDQSKTNKIEVSFKLIDILENWLINHIPTIDSKYVDCFHKNNLF